MKTILIAIIILIASIAVAEVEISYDIGPVWAYSSFYGNSDDYSYIYAILRTEHVYIEFSQEEWIDEVTDEWAIMAEWDYQF